MSVKSYFNIDIPKRKHECSAGQEPLEPDMEHYSVILDTDGNALERCDYCLPCWKKNRGIAQDSKVVTYWKSKVPKKVAGKEVYLNRDEKALALLQSLAKSELQEERQQAFILALYLARKRQIYLRKEFNNEDGVQGQLYEIADVEDAICIEKPTLSQLQIETLQKSIAKKLKDN